MVKKNVCVDSINRQTLSHGRFLILPPLFFMGFSLACRPIIVHMAPILISSEENVSILFMPLSGLKICYLPNLFIFWLNVHCQQRMLEEENKHLNYIVVYIYIYIHMLNIIYVFIKSPSSSLAGNRLVIRFLSAAPPGDSHGGWQYERDGKWISSEGYEGVQPADASGIPGAANSAKLTGEDINSLGSAVMCACILPVRFVMEVTMLISLSNVPYPLDFIINNYGV